MNCNQNSGWPPGARPMSYSCPRSGQMHGFRPQEPGPAIIGPNQAAGFESYPVGMGYVPRQNWETPFPMERGFCRGTIFPSLDYPFVMGRCRG